MMRRNLGFPGDAGAPFGLYTPVRRGLLTVGGDGPATLNSFGLLQRYDPNANGIPAAGPSVVRDLIGYLQADHGLDRDAIMQPDGSTLRTLRQIFEARREETFPRTQEANTAWRAPEGWPPATILTGQGNTTVGPYPGIDDANALYAQLRQQQRRAPAPQRTPPRSGVAPRPVPPRQLPQRRPAPGAGPARPDIPRAPGLERQPWREWAPMRERGPAAPGDVEYWNALNQDPTLGSRAREVFDMMSYVEGGSDVDRHRRTGVPVARGGITQKVLDEARAAGSPLRDMLRNVRTPADLTPDHRVAITRFYFDREMARAGASRGITGTQLIDHIGNRPYAGARETATIIADSFLRRGAPRTIGDTRDAVNGVIRQLGGRAPRGLQPLPDRMDVFGGQALAAIEALIDSGHGSALHAALAARYRARAHLPGDVDRADHLQGLRLPPMGSLP